MIHGRLANIKRKRRYGRVHQDAEVIAQICACDAERPHGGEDEGIAGEEDGDGGVFDEGGGEGRVGGLGGEGFVVAVEVVSWRDDGGKGVGMGTNR